MEAITSPASAPHRTAPGAASAVVRPATLSDLPAILRLEEAGFAADRFNRAQYHHLIARANATVLVAEVGGQVVGSAVMAWRRNSTLGRFYSLVTDPKHQGNGIGGGLMAACEEAALKRGCTRIGLEVRVDNKRAIAMYERRGYRLVDTRPGYYEDGANGLRMVKPLRDARPAELRLDVPYHAQTLEFTCGPACLMMAMKYLTPQLKLDRELELVLWKEATLVFMTSGLGGCEAFGLAVAAQRRGYHARVMVPHDRTPFQSSVRSSDKREVMTIVHKHLKRQARELGVEEQRAHYSFEDIARAMHAGEAPIVLISLYRLHGEKVPHWVIVTGFDRESIYFHDPYVGLYPEDPKRARNVRVPIAEFRRMRKYGKDITRSVVFLSLMRRPLRKLRSTGTGA